MSQGPQRVAPQYSCFVLLDLCGNTNSRTKRKKEKAPIPLAAAQSRKILSSVIVPEKESAKTMKLTSCLWNP